MPVTLVLGRAGSAKSRYVRHAIAQNKAAGVPALLLVPEQQTYESELALIRALGTEGLWDVEVLSFSRLAKRVLGETGAAWGTFIDSAGLCMALRRVLQQCGSELQAFGGVYKRSGFAGVCLDYLQRCKQYDISPQQLSGASEHISSPLLRAKLHDLALIQTHMTEFLSSRYLDACDEMDACIRQLPQCRSLRNAHVYIDGFERMNAQRYRVIEALMLHCAHLTVTLRVDPDENVRDKALFVIERHALERIARLCAEHAQQVEYIRLPQTDAPWGGARKRDEALEHLERELHAVPQHAYKQSTRSLTLTPCANAEEEARLVCCEIARLVREGLRYRDIAVVVDDLERYAQVVERAMALLEIPCFLDASHPLAGHALAELILASLKVASRGFDTREVLRVAKSGFADVMEDETELLENMALRRGMQSKTWTHALDDEPDNALEEARSRLIHPLAALRSAISEAEDIRACATALLDYLETLGVRVRLEQWQARLYEQGRHALAQENAQVWHIVMSLLDQLVAILGDVPVNAAGFASLLEEGMASHEVGAIPSTADEVSVSDRARTRMDSVRVLFYLGANERGGAGEGFINSVELENMRAQGLEVWPDAGWEAAQDRVLMHAVLSRPTDTLHVSYACMDTDGRGLSPSLLVKQLQRCFPGALRLTDGGQAVYSDMHAMESLCRHLARGGELPQNAKDIWAYLWRGEKGQADALLHMLQSGPHKEHISQVSAQRLYGKRVKTTASRIELFYRCPFAHMATYGIRAKPRKERKAAQPDAGLLLHKALEEAVREIIQAGLDWRLLGEAELGALLERTWERLCETVDYGLWRSTGRLQAQATRLKRIAHKALLAICRQYAQGDFAPKGVEMVFGHGEAYPAVPLGEHALLSGKIDRVDVFHNGDDYARIVDYKLGDPPLKYADLASGARLQLLLYMSAAQHIGRSAWNTALKPAGMFLMGLNDPLLDEDEASSPQRLRGLMEQSAELMRAMDHGDGASSEIVRVRRRKEDGAPYGAQVLSASALEKSVEFAKKQAMEAAERMLQGAAEAVPLEQGGALVCAYCDYRGACGFDANAQGARIRLPQARTRDDFLALIGED